MRHQLVASLRLAAVALAAMPGARAADIGWNGVTPDLNTGSNWTGNLPPAEADRAVFSGASAVSALTLGASFQGAANGVGGLLVTSGQTADLSFNATTANVVFRLAGNAGVTIDSGAGRVSWGESASFFFLNMGGTSGTANFVNNSANAAVIGQNATLGPGGSTTQTAVFGGAGDWTVRGVIRAGSGTVAVSKTGAGVLTLTAPNTYNGTTTLGAGTTVLSGGDNRLPTATALAFSGTSALQMPGVAQTVAALTLPVANASSATVVSGAGGALAVSGATSLQFGPSGTLNASRLATVDLSGLSAFSYTSATGVFRVGLAAGTQNSAALAQVADVRLATQNTITATAFNLGDITANNDGGISTLRLGQVNQVNVDSANLGAGGRSDVNLSFAPGLTNPSLVIRGAAGGETASGAWSVGRLAQFAGAAQTSFTATVDLSAGSVDARVGALVIGSADTAGGVNRAGTQTATFTMGEGILRATSITVGRVAGSATSSVGAAFTGNGTFTLNHANGTVSTPSLVLADNTITATGTFAKTARGTFNLAAGTLLTSSISRGVQSGTGTTSTAFNWTSGTIENTAGANLAVTGVPLNLIAGTHTFRATGANEISLDAASSLSGAGGFSKTGTGTLRLQANANGYTGDTVVQEGTLALSAANANNLASSSRLDIRAGATLDSSGLAGGTLDLAPGQTITGSGTVSGGLIVDMSAVISPGASPGTLTTGALTLGGGGTLRFELDRVDFTQVGQDALLGLNDGHDHVAAQGALAITADAVTPFQVEVISLEPSDTPGPVAGWDPNLNYTWRLASSTGLTGFDSSSFVLNTTDFAARNTVAGDFFLSASGTDLFLNYRVVPEPASAALVALGLAALIIRRARKFSRIH